MGDRGTVVGSHIVVRVTRRLARGLSCSEMTTPSFVAGLSQVRPERLIESEADVRTM